MPEAPEAARTPEAPEALPHGRLPRTVWSQALRDNRRALAGWTAGTALAGAMYASFYPQIGGSMGDLTRSFPEGLRQAFHMEDLSSAAGYLGSTPFGLVVPLLALFHGAAAGARAVAGDEESGYLDLLLAHPVGRVRLVLQRYAALATGSAAVAGGVLLMMLAVRGPADLGGIPVTAFAAQCLNLALFGAFFGALALCIGCFVGRRGTVFGATAAVGVLSYAANALGPLVGLGWTRRFSAFHYYIGGDPLRNGFQWAHAGVLAAVCAVLVLLGAWAFRRRDIGV
ncbi:ABC transporter permease [Streptacidiphilus sp. ASG 303]|uniref:ABC transporter permease subunit n=1 Tax=Streptacidiphilus sp. ASG 303 TaxID=2896847 RepID=UPI001E4704EE|nr:ABC transporter permease subunit [Streptacidiphilus sp. ASG 303]MCD0482437.1 ABC transporter permease [Streptacidiphilus sp. ASG 303]